MDILVWTCLLFICKQDICIRTYWCPNGISGIVFLQWAEGQSKVDEMVILCLLSGTPDNIGHTSSSYLRKH